MNSKERVLTTLEHEEPDRVPLTDHIYMSKSLEGILGERGVSINTPDKYVKVHRLLGLDLICSFLDSADTAGLQNSSKGQTVNDWGVRYRSVNGMLWYIEGPIKKVEDFNTYTPPDPNLSCRFRSTAQIIDLVKEEMAVAGIVDGLFTKCWLLSGFDLFVKTVFSKPLAVHTLLDRITRYIIDVGIRQIEIGVDLIWIADDLGTIDGPFLKPSLFREMIFPYYKRIIDTFKNHKVKVLLHSDGQIMPLMEDLVQIGLDGIHPIERKAGMDILEVKEKYGDKISIIGNVDATNLLPFEMEESIKKQVYECIKVAAPGGGYILGSDHSIHEGVKPSNAVFMFRVARKYGRYPIRL